MENKKNQNNNEPQISLDFLKISPDVLRVTLFKRLIWIIAAGLAGLVLSTICTKIFIKDKWTSTCVLYRLPQSPELKKEIPSLYDPPDINTVIESIRIRTNIMKVIKNTKLNISVDAFLAKTKVVKQKNNTLFTIVAEDKDRYTSAAIANELAEAFLESYAEMMQSSAKKLNDQYRSSAENIKKEIEKMEDKSRKVLLDNEISSIDAETNINFQKLNDMQIKLLENKAAAETAKIRLQDLRFAISQMSSEVQISYVITPPEAGVMQDLQKELNALMQKFTEENPKVKKIKSEIDALKKRAEDGERPKPDHVTFGSNQAKKDLEMESMRTESSLKSALKNIETYQLETKETRKNLDRISSISEKYNEIRRTLEQKKQALTKIEQMIAISELSVKPNSLDIKIMEPATPPPYPDSTKRKMIVIAIGMLMFLGATVIFLGMELLDLTVKAGYDISGIFKILNLGTLPDRDRVNVSLFNTAFQVVFKSIETETAGKKTPFIVLGGVSPGTGKSMIISECTRILKSRKKKVLVIGKVENAVHPEGKIPGLINPFLYEGAEFKDFSPVEIDAGLSMGYFNLDDSTFSYPLDEEKLRAFIKSQDSYDIIFWELFEFQNNVRLFAEICKESDLFILTMKFRKCRKIEVLSCLKFLKKQQPARMGGVLNCVDNDYFTLS